MVAELKGLNRNSGRLMRIDFAELDAMSAGGVMMDWADPFRSDSRVPVHVIEATKAALERREVVYSLPIGLLALRQSVSKRLKEVNGIEADPSNEVVITPGSDAGLHHAFRALLEPGDEVIVPEPCYPLNFGNATLAGATAVPLPLRTDQGYQIHLEELRRRVSPRTKLIVLTQPNNPTGTIYSRASLLAVGEVAQDHGLYVISDQAFEANAFDRRPVCSIASLPGMWDRTITVFSTSKAMGLSGFRVGYSVACERLMQVLYNSAVLILGAPNTFAQHGVLAALADDQFVSKFNTVYDYRRRRLYEALNAIPGVRTALPEAGFMAWVDISSLGTSGEVAQHIRNVANITVNSGTTYGPSGAGFLRIVFGAVGADADFEVSLAKMVKALVGFPKKTPLRAG
jgi:aspartate/methionine/tyrosine aminotransferase